mmetsp:Transcript_29595/g.40149  ORF Transcript_29595/g.40149 Transcript_29595/m.40149 type:complete len:95 (+) Transcript_29595:1407-1691(+)
MKETVIRVSSLLSSLRLRQEVFTILSHFLPNKLVNMHLAWPSFMDLPGLTCGSELTRSFSARWLSSPFNGCRDDRLLANNRGMERVTRRLQLSG